jgi:hypothetical protein
MMPNQEEFKDLEINNVKLNVRVEAISQRLDEVLDEVKEIKTWFKTWGTAAFFLAVLGDKAIPLLTKIFG